ncbi:MAG: flavodoxin family protein [Candidatus Goldbacteria bacterium]|nr:flavodoxin family protein [Candidatus Goldiibacteriota bacterium]
MADVLLINASPRKKSNSAKAAEILLKLLNIKNAGIVDINSLKIKPCTACGKCSKTFRCVYRDDADMLILKIKKAKTVIIASPVYFCGVPAPLKAFIDRNQPEWERHNKKKTAVKTKGIIILTAGSGKKKYFLPAKTEIASMFAVNGIKTPFVMTFGNMDKTGAAEKSPLCVKKIKALAGLINGRD